MPTTKGGDLRPYDKIWQQRYDREALTAREEYQSLFHYSQRQQLEHMRVILGLLSRYGLKSGMALLDAGCGTGFYLRKIPESFPGIVTWGADISFNLLTRSEARVMAQGGCLLQATVDSLPYADGAFDFVICAGVIQTVDDANAALGELVRVLKQGGGLVISTLRRHSIWELPLATAMMFFNYCEPGKGIGNLLRMVRNRSFLSWDRLPDAMPPRKYPFRQIERSLASHGMTNITHTYSGKIRLPLLYNSHHMFIAARKPVKNRGQAVVAENEAIK